MSFYKLHPLTCARDDFWGQVKRTVNGKPVSEEQIRMIVDAGLKGLNLAPQDRLLDLCCGNGALSRYFFAACESGLGVDYSEPLIEVARENFEQAPDFVFQLADVVEYAQAEPAPERFTKALCYGSFQYLGADAATALLATLRERFSGLARLFIGNLPDRERMGLFYGDRESAPGIEHDPDSAIGVWRTEAEFAELARACGWSASFSRMPGGYYAAAYRYDALLTPARPHHV